MAELDEVDLEIAAVSLDDGPRIMVVFDAAGEQSAPVRFYLTLSQAERVGVELLEMARSALAWSN